MKTGIELITNERDEQINKHGFDVSNNEDYSKGQLLDAAHLVLRIRDTEYSGGYSDHRKEQRFLLIREDWPWQSEFGLSMFDKLLHKSEAELLTIAGALLAAQIDRLQLKK